MQEIVAHITNALGIDSVTKWPPDVIQEGGKRVEVMAEGCSVSLELPGFAWSHAEPNKTTGASGFYRLMKCVTFVFTEFSSGYERGLLRAAVPAEHQLDDTALMEQTRDFASGYLEECGYRDIGVHTVVAQGYRHFAISYWNTNVGAWSRKYSITIPHPATGKNFETVVTFTHFGSFIDFLRSTPLMGHVVATLKVEVKNGAS